MATAYAVCPDCGDDGPHMVVYDPDGRGRDVWEAECRACMIVFDVLPEAVEQ